MPKIDPEKNQLFKFSTSNKANNLNIKYSKNTIEQLNSGQKVVKNYNYNKINEPKKSSIVDFKVKLKNISMDPN